MRAIKPNKPSRFAHIIDCQHLCLLLEQLPPDDSISIDELDDLFELLGVETSIDNLYLVLTNLGKWASIVEKICDHPKWHYAAATIRQCHETAQVLEKYRQLFSNAIHTIHDKEHNDSFKGLVTSNPLYTTLGYLPKSRTNLAGYHQLLTHILLYHIQSTRKGRQVRIKPTLHLAIEAIRRMCRDKKSKLASLLPATPLPPEDYLKALRSIVETTYLPPIFRYLTRAINQPRRRTERTENLALTPALPSDEDPGETTKRSPTLLPTILEEPDLQPDESPNTTSGLVYAFAKEGWQGENPIDLKQAAAQAAKARAKDNQRFHFAWNTLNQQDIRTLFQELFPTSAPEPLDERKTRLQMALVFLVGMPATRIAALKVATSADAPSDFDCYLSDLGTLRLISRGPEYKTVLDETAQGQAHPKQNFIDLELPSYLAQAMGGYLAGRPQAVGPSPLFPDTAQEVQNSCKKFISRVKKVHGNQLTLGRIQGFMDRFLASRPGSDLSAASLTLGKELYLARTMVHYAAFDADTLQRQCRIAWSQVAQHSGLSETCMETYPGQPSKHVGTPVRPKIQALQALTANLVAAIETQRTQLRSLQALVDFHNAYTTYTALMIACSTGHRAINAPFIPQGMIDRATGFAVVRDKDSIDYYHSRLVWLPPSCLQHLRLYQQHLEKLKSLSVSTSSLPVKEREDYFFLTSDGHQEPVTKTRLVHYLKTYDFHLPPNVPRHLLKSELQEDGCPVEVIEILLGHWHIGQEPWTQASALHPLDFRSELAKHLPPLLRRLGFAPLTGAKRLPTVQLNLSSMRSQTRAKRPTRHVNRNEEFLATEPPGPAWFNVLGTVFRYKPATDAFKEQQIVVLRKVRKAMPELYAGSQQGLIIPPELVSRLVRNLAPKPKHPRIYFRRLNFFIDGLSWGKTHLGWEVELPPRPVIVPTPYNRVRPSLMKHLQIFRRVERAFLLEVGHPWGQHIEARLGRILFSAILYGGINHLSWAKGFLPGLATHLYQHDKMLWIDLWDHEPSPNSKERWIAQRNPNHYRRWIADPTTKILIYQWLSHHPEDRKEGSNLPLESVIAAYQHHLHNLTKEWESGQEDRPHEPLSVNKLLAVANARATLALPPFLSAFTENRVLSASLPDPAWLRLVAERYIRKTDPTPVGSRKALRASATGDEAAWQRKLLSELRALVSVESSRGNESKKIRNAIENFLAAHNGRLWSSLELLARWAIQLLSPRVYRVEHRQPKPERPSTVSTYLTTFAGTLLDVADSSNLFEMEEDELEILLGKTLQTIRESRTDDNSGPKDTARVDYIVLRLNQFLGYIHAFHEFPELWVTIEKDNVEIRVGSSPRSNILTITEYQRLLTRLGWGRTNLLRIERMTLVATILAFRAGLRLKEIHGLLLSDIQGRSQPQALIHANRFRDLKTDDSRRRLPLKDLLPPAELDMVLGWHAFRSTELGATPTCPLFAAGPVEYYPVREQDLFAPLRAVLKDLTADGSMVVHTLRHAFANWTLFRLSLRAEMLGHQMPAFASGIEFQPSICENFRNSLLENEPIGRKSVHALATVLGHADTETAMNTYIHLSDWLTAYYLSDSRSVPDLEVKTLAALTGFSSSKIYQTRQSGSHPTLVCAEQMSTEHANTLRHPLLDQASLPPHSLQDKQSDLPNKTILPFDLALHTASNAQLPKGVVLPSNHQELALLQKWYERFSQLEKPEQKGCLAAAKMMLLNLKRLGGEVEFTEFAEARQALAFFSLIGIEDHQLLLKYHGSRWVSSKIRKEAHRRWRERLAKKVFFRETLYKHNHRNGCLRIRIESSDGYYYDTKDMVPLPFFLTIITHSDIR